MGETVEMKPVAWRWRYERDDGKVHWTLTQREVLSQPAARGWCEIVAEPLYASPPPAVDAEEVARIEREIVDLLDKFHDGQREKKARAIVADIVGPLLQERTRERDEARADLDSATKLGRFFISCADMERDSWKARAEAQQDLIRRLVEGLEALDPKALELHDWIAEETDHLERIPQASSFVKGLRSLISEAAGATSSSGAPSPSSPGERSPRGS